MIPVLFWVYTGMGMDPNDAYGHTKKGAVWWKAGIVLGMATK